MKSVIMQKRISIFFAIFLTISFLAVFTVTGETVKKCPSFFKAVDSAHELQGELYKKFQKGSEIWELFAFLDTVNGYFINGVKPEKHKVNAEYFFRSNCPISKFPSFVEQSWMIQIKVVGDNQIGSIVVKKEITGI